MPLAAEIRPSEALLYFDFGRGITDLWPAGRTLRLAGARWGDLQQDPLQSAHGPALGFTDFLQAAIVEMPRALQGI